MSQTVLVLGASGRFGRNAVASFSKAGWNTRRFDRRTQNLRIAAQGADVIVNAWNPPYTEWARQVPGLHRKVIETAVETGATVIVPGNTYVYGADAPAPWSEKTPHGARNQLGQIRIEMERAYRSSGVRTIMLRAGDFIDTEASGNWFDKIMTARLARGDFVYPGNPDIPHSWAFLPDLTKAAVQLAEKRDVMPDFLDIPFPGYTLTGHEMVAALSRATGRDLRLRKMSWLPIQLARPVWKMAGSLLEMRYLWNTPHWLDGSRFQQEMPGFEETPVDEALRQALGGVSVGDQIHPDQPVPAGL